MAPTGRLLLSRSRVGMTKMLGILLTVMSGNALALGLGDIELDSALNEELNASIELIDAGGLAPAEILVNLASNEDFERVGVERFFFLTDLEFSVTFGENGAAEVVIESSRPVTEPYLNFIVEVRWPTGRLLKEFTLLLDPPTFSQAAAPAVSAPVESTRSPASTGRVQREAPASAGTRVQVAPGSSTPEPSPLDQDVVGNEYQMTDRDDTLWSIAARTRPSNQVTVHQNMLAIQRLNPEAFIDGNINLLKAGYRLRLPDEATATQLSQNDAVAAVANQNQAWRRGEAVAAAPAPAPAEPASTVAEDRTSQLRSPVDATAETPAPAAAPATEGELRIVAGDGDSATGRAPEGAADAAEVLEENDRLARELEELTYQRERDQELVSNQLTVKDRQLEVKDKEIAELQQQLADLQAQPAPAPAQTQNQSTTDAKWWENPLVLYGGAGALVLALVGGMLAARRRKDSEEDFFEAAAQEPTLSDATSEAEDSGFESFDDDYDEEDTFDVAEEVDDSVADQELPGSETSDVIGEADIYIAYGRYPQAIGLLLGVLEDDPARNDVRLKLLELYSETNDRQAFDEHLAALVEHCEDEDALLSARELEGQFGEKSISLDEVLAEDADGESNIEPDNLDAGTAEEASESSLDLDSELEIADSDADAALNLDTADVDTEIAADVDADDNADDAGFELELDELDTAAEAESAAGGDELGGDLGINFDPDRDVALDGEPEIEDAVADPDRGEPLEFEMATSADSDDDHINLDSLSGDLGATSTQSAAPELDSDVAVAEEDEFDFQDEGDSANTKLDLARAYIDMGDADGARDILKEVVDEGNSEQQQQARGMLESL